MANRNKILLIDDQKEILKMLSVLLSDFETDEALNAIDALELIKEDRYFMIICDFKMPHMSGLELFREIKKAKNPPYFILLTGYGEKEIIKEALNEGINHYFDKPVPVELLLKKVKEVYDLYIEEEANLKELVLSFKEEAFVMLDEIEFKALQLKHSLEALQDVKRILHTLKGSASFIPPLEEIAKIAHKTEDMIKLIPAGETLSPTGIELLLKSKDYMREVFDCVTENRSKKFAFENFLQSLESIENVASALEIRVDEEKAKTTAAREKKGISVPNEVLDLLMEEVGQLIILKNHTHDLQLNAHNDDLKEIYQQLEEISSQIQKTIMEVRKVPLGDLFKSYHRIVHDLAGQFNKQVNLQIDDENVLVDKDIAAAISESLVHLVRNSLDHGIESPQERKLKNKVETATLTFKARNKSQHIILEVSDDGRGIDPEKVMQKAIEKKLINEDAIRRMTANEIQSLIFLPGFSTKTVASTTSGRGEGMDIVQNTITKLKGTIQLSSTLNTGTSFAISIPAPQTVNIMNALLVNIDGYNFGIPTEFVRKVIRKRDAVIRTVDSKTTVFSHQEEIIHLADLKDLIDFQFIAKLTTQFDKEREECIILLDHKHKTLGLRVNGIDQIMQIVSRNLDKSLEHLDIFKGTAILKNGKPALILNYEAIFNRYENVHELN